ncbi:hypothetical protein [Streptomyces sp. NPDC005374]
MTLIAQADRNLPVGMPNLTGQAATHPYPTAEQQGVTGDVGAP